MTRELRGKKIDFARLAAGQEQEASGTDSASDDSGEQPTVTVSKESVPSCSETIMSSNVKDKNVINPDIINGSESESDSSSEVLDAELRMLELQKERMKTKLEKKKKKEQIEMLRAENELLKAQLRDGPTAVRSKKGSSKECPAPSTINLGGLRQMESLVSSAEQRMKACGVVVSSDSSDSELERSRGKKRKSLKSGQVATVAHCVQKQLCWPHTQLRYSYSQSNLTFSQLDFPLLVAGELTCILSPSLDPGERDGRLRLLQATAYHSKAFEWQACLDFFSTCLLEIERGDRSWGDNRSWLVEEANTLYQHPLRGDRSSRGPGVPGGRAGAGRRWFCQGFQRGECNHKGSHNALVKGVRRTVEHFCAACFQKHKSIKSHPDSSKECPLRSSSRP